MILIRCHRNRNDFFSVRFRGVCSSKGVCYSVSTSYAECDGDAPKRYKYAVSKYMVRGSLGNIALGTASCALMIIGKKNLCIRT